MSKENVKRFQDELIKNEALKKELKDFNPSSKEDLVSFAGEKGFIFTVDEFKEMQQVTKKETEILSDDKLAQVSAGALERCPNCGSSNLLRLVWGDIKCRDCKWSTVFG
ncbi:MAG: Nif11-like leader peptide family natural product precursor [Desulfotomaculaceae bacterium]|nr:Nif11-like leader peptide family natural product precursor [Desulfotomaculaceae bacterium]